MRPVVFSNGGTERTGEGSSWEIICVKVAFFGGWEGWKGKGRGL